MGLHQYSSPLTDSSAFPLVVEYASKMNSLLSLEQIFLPPSPPQHEPHPPPDCDFQSLESREMQANHGTEVCIELFNTGAHGRDWITFRGETEFGNPLRLLRGIQPIRED